MSSKTGAPSVSSSSSVPSNYLVENSSRFVTPMDMVDVQGPMFDSRGLLTLPWATFIANKDPQGVDGIVCLPDSYFVIVLISLFVYSKPPHCFPTLVL